MTQSEPVLTAIREAIVDAETDDEVPWAERPRPSQVLAGLHDRGFDVVRQSPVQPVLSRPDPRVWRTFPDEDGEGGETWRAAFADQAAICSAEHSVQPVLSGLDALRTIRAELVGFAEPYEGADPAYQRGKQYGLQLAIGAIDARLATAPAADEAIDARKFVRWFLTKPVDARLDFIAVAFPDPEDRAWLAALANPATPKPEQDR